VNELKMDAWTADERTESNAATEPSLSFLSSGRLSSVWRLDGVFKGCVARLLRPGAERPYGSADPLAHAIGRQYLHKRLADVSLDEQTLRETCSEDAAARAAALRTVGAAISAAWRAGCTVDGHGCVASLEVDHTRMLLCSPGAAASPAPAVQLPLTPPVGPSEPCLCVEIKPKCGVLPSGLAATHPLHGFCRFCIRENLKREPGVPRSDYCPLDLYSMHRPRLERALHSLLASPRNNLRIFAQGGQLRFGGARGGSSREALWRELWRELGGGAGDAPLTVARSGVAGGQGEVLEAVLVRVVASALLQEPLLPRLQSVQAASTLSAEGALRTYEEACAAVGREKVDRQLRPRSDDAAGVSMRGPPDARAGLAHGRCGEADRASALEVAPMRACAGMAHEQCGDADSHTADAVAPVRAWLQALCASDVSLMLCVRKLEVDPATARPALQPDSSRAPGVVCVSGEGGGVFAYRVAVVDTMPKPPSKLAEHARRDGEAASLPAPRARPCGELSCGEEGRIDGSGGVR
jgi:hypothetical protein